MNEEGPKERPRQPNVALACGFPNVLSSSTAARSRTDRPRSCLTPVPARRAARRELGVLTEAVRDDAEAAQHRARSAWGTACSMPALSE